jgi:predicted MFS family arabinose efflux permease
MDAKTARDQLERAERARTAAQVPRIPAGGPVLIGACVAAGLLVLGLFPYSAGWRIAAVALALLLWGAAGWWIVQVRERQGIRGLRGSTRTSATTLAICALALVPGALGADSAMRLPYVVAAAAGGVAMWWVARRNVRDA